MADIDKIKLIERRMRKRQVKIRTLVILLTAIIVGGFGILIVVFKSIEKEAARTNLNIEREFKEALTALEGEPITGLMMTNEPDVETIRNSLPVGSTAVSIAVTKKALDFLVEGHSANWKWGGKDPEVGFDSSGFIAYLLNEYELLEDDLMTYWSVKLRSEFGLQSLTLSNIELGDLIFYQGGWVLLHLGQIAPEWTIGMGSTGLRLRNLDFGPRIEGFGRYTNPAN